MMIMVPSEGVLFTFALFVLVGWKAHSDRPLLKKYWGHLLGGVFLLFVLFYRSTLQINGIPFAIDRALVWVVTRIMLQVALVGFILGFGFNRMWHGKKKGKRK